MSRFFFSAVGSLGDLHPYIAVARELFRRGHDAVIATAEDCGTAIQCDDTSRIVRTLCTVPDKVGDRRAKRRSC